MASDMDQPVNGPKVTQAGQDLSSPWCEWDRVHRYKNFKWSPVQSVWLQVRYADMEITMQGVTQLQVLEQGADNEP